MNVIPAKAGIWSKVIRLFKTLDSLPRGNDAFIKEVFIRITLSHSEDISEESCWVKNE